MVYNCHANIIFWLFSLVTAILFTVRGEFPKEIILAVKIKIMLIIIPKINTIIAIIVEIIKIVILIIIAHELFQL